jgi:Dyp-type peroxidase family
VNVEELATQLGEIQGNILAGFNKDHQAFVFLSFGGAKAARHWLADLVDDVATTAEVKAFNDLFKAVVRRRHGREGVVEATWLNVAFTYRGLRRIGAPGLVDFPVEFREGMAKRAKSIGDEGASAPREWIEPLRRAPKRRRHDALLILASDSSERLEREIVRRTEAATAFGVHVSYVQEGHVRADLRGHEHFGFKDGISQPGIKGYTPNRSPDPAQGDPGQDLVFPGEFVVGYPRMRRPPTQSTDCPNGPATEGGEADFDNPGTLSTGGPPWTANGSFLVFRRLRQNVPAFWRFVAEVAEDEQISESLAGAKLVGRYASGAPLERTEDQPRTLDTQAGDPSIAHPSILRTSKINNFEFHDDESGMIVPRAAHIRKVYPRDEATPGGGEADAQTHRLLRRGIPFGKPYDMSSGEGRAEAFPNDRGLLFLCYQSSIAEQFEFVQRCWVNNRSFPRPDDGIDPIISQNGGTRDFAMPGGVEPRLCPVPHLVTTTGGDYFFQPSISALKDLARV